jgi:hypothetical protein
MGQGSSLTASSDISLLVSLTPARHLRCSLGPQGHLTRMLREAGTDKLLIEAVELRYCHAKVLPRSPPRAAFDLFVLFETATILHGDAGPEESIETVDGRMMFPVMDTTKAEDIEIEVEVPDSLSQADEGTVVAEVRKLGPKVWRLLHDKFVPALMGEAKTSAKLNPPPKPSTDMRAWLRALGLHEYFEVLAQNGVDLAALRGKKSAELHQFGLPTSAGFVIRKKVEEEQAAAQARAELARDMKGAGGGDAAVEGLSEDDVRRAQVLRSHFGHALLAPGAADESSGEEEGEEDKPPDDSILYPVHKMLRTEVIGIYFGAVGRRRPEDLEFEQLLKKSYARLRAEDSKSAGGKGAEGDDGKKGAIAPEQRLEVVYVSHDHSIDEFRTAREGSPWLALQWADKRQKARLCHAYQVRHALTRHDRTHRC